MTSTDNDITTGQDAGFPRIGDILVDRYELLDILGKGGMGVVIKGRDLRLERTVAIKLMHPNLAPDDRFVRRFEREVLIAKDLAHPNTVRIYDFGMTDAGAMFLVMEHLVGRELKEVLSEEGPMTIGRVLELGKQLLDGLGEAHTLDVVHRDLKPGNIFICRDRRDREMIKILDFGIAKSLGAGGTAITQTGEFVGTARYLAPEVYLEGERSKPADIYSCGLVMLEMLYGRPVFEVSAIGELLSRHLRMPVLLPPFLLRHPLSDVLLQAIEKSPAKRYSDAEEMLDDLEQIEPEGLADRIVPPQEVDETLERMNEAFSTNMGGIVDNSSEIDAEDATAAESPGARDDQADNKADSIQVSKDLQPTNTEIVVLDDTVDDGDFHAASTVVSVPDDPNQPPEIDDATSRATPSAIDDEATSREKPSALDNAETTPAARSSEVAATRREPAVKSRARRRRVRSAESADDQPVFADRTSPPGEPPLEETNPVEPRVDARERRTSPEPFDVGGLTARIRRHPTVAGSIAVALVALVGGGIWIGSGDTSTEAPPEEPEAQQPEEQFETIVLTSDGDDERRNEEASSDESDISASEQHDEPDDAAEVTLDDDAGEEPDREEEAESDDPSRSAQRETESEDEPPSSGSSPSTADSRSTSPSRSPSPSPPPSPEPTGEADSSDDDSSDAFENILQEYMSE